VLSLLLLLLLLLLLNCTLSGILYPRSCLP
jgi:hypothetical protein